MNAPSRCASPVLELSPPPSRAGSPVQEAPDANLNGYRWTREEFDAIKARNMGDQNASVFAQMNVQIRTAEQKAHGTRAQLMVCASMVDQTREAIQLHQQHIEQLQAQFAAQMAQHQAQIARHEAIMSDMQAHMANLSLMEREQTSIVTATKEQARDIMLAVAACATPAAATVDYLDPVDPADPADAPLEPPPDAAPCLVPIENGETEDENEKPVAEALAMLAPRARSPASDTTDEGAQPQRRERRSKRGGRRVQEARARAAAAKEATIGDEIEQNWNIAFTQGALIAPYTKEETSES